MSFCCAERRLAVGISSPSSVKPRRGPCDFFNHVMFSLKNGAKLGSKDKMYSKFCRHASNDVIVSVLVRDHCFGALVVVIFRFVLCKQNEYTYLRLSFAILDPTTSGLARYESFAFSWLYLIWYFVGS